MSNTVGYSLGGCTVGVRYNLTQGEDATGNAVSFAALGCAPGCWNGDYRNRAYWAQLPVSATAVSGGTDYYGALAPTLKFRGGGTYRDICPTVCYCEGPVAEGETATEYLGRYETRWMALLVGGLIYYGRVDGTLIQVSTDLFPDPLADTATHIALSFDANARPVFAYEDDGTVYIRRFVAGVPTTYAWTGTSPCLFFNGVIYYEDSQTDVVCYYLLESGGALYARFQRENFGVANLVVEDPSFDSLAAVDRGRGALSSFTVVELSGKRVFASMYPPWPFFAQENGFVPAYGVEGVEYALISKELGAYTEPGLAPPYGIEAIEYQPQVVSIPADTEAGSVPAYGVESVAYDLIVVAMGTYTEEGAVPAYAVESLAYDLVSVNAGTYTEAGSSPAYGVESITYE